MALAQQFSNKLSKTSLEAQGLGFGAVVVDEVDHEEGMRELATRAMDA